MRADIHEREELVSEPDQAKLAPRNFNPANAPVGKAGDFCNNVSGHW